MHASYCRSYVEQRGLPSRTSHSITDPDELFTKLDEILDQRPDIDDFVMIVGTGGCAMGTARSLRTHADVTVTVVEPAERYL